MLLQDAFAGQIRSSPQYKTIFSFTEDMQKRLGQPLTVNGAVATEAWLEKNPRTEVGIREALSHGMTLAQALEKYGHV